MVSKKHIYDADDRKSLLQAEREEITAYHVYRRLAERLKDDEQRRVIKQMAADELTHYQVLEKITGQPMSYYKGRYILFYLITRFLGLTFGLKLLEKDERAASLNYTQLIGQYPALKKELIKMQEDELVHEEKLVDLIQEEKLEYIGSVVLGLNDALVELTGALAGYTFAFQNTQLIGLTGLITGISASFSMAASEYLATRQKSGNSTENKMDDKALKSSVYTGISYIITVIFLILPFLLIKQPFISLAISLTVAVLIIFVFNYYISIAKGYHFKKRFTEMALISLGVSAFTFLVGVLIKEFIGIEV